MNRANLALLYLVGDILRDDGGTPLYDGVCVPLQKVQHLSRPDARCEGSPHTLSCDRPYDHVRQPRTQLQKKAEHSEVQLWPSVRHDLG